MSRPMIGLLLAVAFQALELVAVADFAPGQVLCLQGEATALDSSGAANHGTWTGTQAYATGVFGRAFSFTGANNVTIPYSAQINPAQFTIAAWVRPTGGAGTIRTIISCRQVSPNLGYGMFAWSDNNYIFHAAAGGIFQPVSFGAVVLNEWTFLTATYDGTRVRVYRAGLEINGWNQGYDRVTTSSTMIGALTDSGPRLRFPGQIDAVRVFDRSLTADEIRQLLHSYGPRRRN